MRCYKSLLSPKCEIVKYTRHQIFTTRLFWETSWNTFLWLITGRSFVVGWSQTFLYLSQSTMTWGHWHFSHQRQCSGVKLISAELQLMAGVFSLAKLFWTSRVVQCWIFFLTCLQDFSRVSLSFFSLCVCMVNSCSSPSMCAYWYLLNYSFGALR